MKFLQEIYLWFAWSNWTKPELKQEVEYKDGRVLLYTQTRVRLRDGKVQIRVIKVELVG
jgi:hypothetical protein